MDTVSRPRRVSAFLIDWREEWSIISFGRCLGKGSRGRNPVSDVTVTGDMDMFFLAGCFLFSFIHRIFVAGSALGVNILYIEYGSTILRRELTQ